MKPVAISLLVLMAAVTVALLAQQPTAYTPAQAPGCLFFAQADDVASVGNGNPVSTWASESGCGSASFTQSGSARPALNLGGFLGTHSSLTLDGSSLYMTSSGLATFPATIYAVIRVNDLSLGSGTREIVGGDISAGSSYGSYYAKAMQTTTYFTGMEIHNVNTGFSPGFVGNYQTPDNTWALVGILTDTSTSPGNVIQTIRVNRTTITTATNAGAVLTPNNVALGAGYYAHGIVDYCPCDIAALFLSSQALSGNDLQNLEDWFERTYWPGLSSGGNNYGYVSFICFDSQFTRFWDLQTSEDGLTNWTRRPFGQVAFGGIDTSTFSRDPAFAYYHGYWWATSSYTANLANQYSNPDVALYQSYRGGLFHMVGTLNGAFGTVTSGSDGIWAPGVFVDSADVFHIFSGISYNGEPHHPVEIHNVGGANLATTTWSPPVQITLTGAPSNESFIDLFMFQDGATYYLLGKNQTPSNATGYIELWSSNNLTGPYTNVWTNKFQGFEGPFILRKPGGGWRIYLDSTPVSPALTPTGYYYSEAATLTGTWSALQALNTAAVSFPGYTTGYCQHGEAHYISGAGPAVE
jgi:hypothetical protein